MPTYTASGLVLRRTNLGENDRVLTIYTRELGKISTIAKGARKPNSRLTGATEPFTYCRMLLGTGKTLDVISQCEIRSSFRQLREDLARIARASYFCELLDRMTQERDALQAPELLTLTLSALRLLGQVELYLDGVVHAFELRLLTAEGYAPELENCIRCGESIERRTVGFSPHLGGVLCQADRNTAEDAVSLSHEALALMRFLREARTSELMQLQPGPKPASEVARALRWYIRCRLERDLKSADFLDSLRASG